MDAGKSAYEEDVHRQLGAAALNGMTIMVASLSPLFFRVPGHKPGRNSRNP